MSSASNDNGRGYEYACLNVLYNEISKLRECIIIENSSFYSAQHCFHSLDNIQQETYFLSALSVVETLFSLEPLLLEKSNDVLELIIQPDSKGESGDVRDIVLLRSSIGWEIGLSIKHGHFAVKHSRLSKTIDFSEKWFGRRCSNVYWKNVLPIFEYLDNERQKEKKWSDLHLKDVNIYVPLLEAFINEIIYQNRRDPSIPKKLVEYLLGKYDFYKVISLDYKRMTQFQTFNLHGTLNMACKGSWPEIEIPVVNLPTRIVHIDFKPNSTNTIEMYMDNGWQFSFRIHNASTYVESSLKFDIQIVGMPATIISISCEWR